MDELTIKRVRENHEIDMLIPNEDVVEIRFARNNLSVIALYEGQINGTKLAFMHRSRVYRGSNDEIRSIRVRREHITALPDGALCVEGEKYEYYRPSDNGTHERKQRVLEVARSW